MITSRAQRACRRYQRQIRHLCPRPKARVVQPHFAVPSRQFHRPILSKGVMQSTYRNDPIFGLDELVEPFTQRWMHVTPQATESESMG